MEILLTGASGFVGQALMIRLQEDPAVTVKPVYRDANSELRTERSTGAKTEFVIPDMSSSTDWGPGLSGISVVIHAAARVHVMNDLSADPLAEFRKVNVEGTLNLARQAAAQGVSRFVFISSIKVNGESTRPGSPFNYSSPPTPVDPYGISKWEAEKGLTQIAEETGMEVVIIRPVLVYGPGVKANFRSMLSWMNKGVPLPLGAIKNKRSMVALDNLVDLIVTCIDHPAAANQTFLVSDGEDLSTSQLLRRTAGALDKHARLLPVPSGLLEFSAALLGKRAVAERLCGSLQVDISHTCKTLSWQPPVTVDAALRKTAEAFTASR